MARQTSILVVPRLPLGASVGCRCGGEEHAGFGYAVKAALERVATPLVCVVQHDNAFVRRVNLAPVARALLAGELVRYVGLMSSATADYESLCMSRYGVRLPGAFEVERCKLVPLIYWYDKTHLASVDYYRSLFDAVYEKAPLPCF